MDGKIDELKMKRQKNLKVPLLSLTVVWSLKMPLSLDSFQFSRELGLINYQLVNRHAVKTCCSLHQKKTCCSFEIRWPWKRMHDITSVKCQRECMCVCTWECWHREWKSFSLLFVLKCAQLASVDDQRICNQGYNWTQEMFFAYVQIKSEKTPTTTNGMHKRYAVWKCKLTTYYDVNKEQSNKSGRTCE